MPPNIKVIDTTFIIGKELKEVYLVHLLEEQFSFYVYVPNILSCMVK